MAKCSGESLAPEGQWMEKVCQRENLWQAFKRVKGNGGSPGIDGMTIDNFADYLKRYWITIREQLFQARIRVLTRRTRGISIEKMVREVGRYLQGWQSYFGFCQTPTVLDRFNKWIRRRIRSAACKQWRTGKSRYARLRKLDLSHDLAARTTGHQWGPWRLSRTQALPYAMPATYFDSLGLLMLHCTPGA
jgi:hypothetical protein